MYVLASKLISIGFGCQDKGKFPIYILASKPCLSPFWMHGYTWDLEIFQSQALDARIEIRKPYRHLADGSRTDEFQSYGATVGLEISNSVLGHHVTLFNGKHEEALQTPIGAEKIFLTSKFSIPRWHCRIGKCQYGRNPYSLFDQKKSHRRSVRISVWCVSAHSALKTDMGCPRTGFDIEIFKPVVAPRVGKCEYGETRTHCIFFNVESNFS